MELAAYIKPTLTREESFFVEDIHTAYHIGSGDERVLGTPWMISFMERVSNRLIARYLPEGYMSVGFHIDVKHLAATPVNATVRIKVEVLDVYKNRIVVKVEAWDHLEKIGEGTHQRAAVEKSVYMKRVLGKGAT
jgi:predicted thioesterase